jgi:hypothetical protein
LACLKILSVRSETIIFNLIAFESCIVIHCDEPFAAANLPVWPSSRRRNVLTFLPAIDDGGDRNVSSPISGARLHLFDELYLSATDSDAASTIGRENPQLPRVSRQQPLGAVTADDALLGDGRRRVQGDRRGHEFLKGDRIPLNLLSLARNTAAP